MDPRQFASKKLTAIRTQLANAVDLIEKQAILNRGCEHFPSVSEFWLQLIESFPGDKSEIWQTALQKQPYSAEIWSAFLNSVYGSSFASAEQAQKYVGSYFLSGDIWKLMLDRAPEDRRAPILREAIRAPIYEYAEFYQLANDAQVLPYEQLASMAEVMGDLITKRWEFESQLRTQSFSANELSREELKVWNDYLDYAESLVSTLDRANFDPLSDCQQLYHKCLMITALYPAFWHRFVRFLRSQGLETLDVLKTAVKYHPKNQWLRTALAAEEEKQGNLEAARAHFAYSLPDLINFDLRNQISPSLDVEYARVYEQLVGEPVASGQNVEKLMESWHQNKCENAVALAEQLKAAGHLKEFFCVDATLS